MKKSTTKCSAIPQQQRAGDWKCIICSNVNFAFRYECNRCGLISKQQNDHQNNMLAYGSAPEKVPCFLTPLRKKDRDAMPTEEGSPIDESSVNIMKSANAGLLSVSPVLRQLGL